MVSERPPSRSPIWVYNMSGDVRVKVDLANHLPTSNKSKQYDLAEGGSVADRLSIVPDEFGPIMWAEIAPRKKLRALPPARKPDPKEKFPRGATIYPRGMGPPQKSADIVGDNLNPKVLASHQHRRMSSSDTRYKSYIHHTSMRVLIVELPHMTY